MRKVVLGISVYPRHSDFKEIQTYLTKAKANGFSKIFTSLFYLDQPSLKVNLPKYLNFFKLAKKLGFYIIADIGPEVLKVLDDDYQFTKLKSFGIDCLRLDTPLLASVVADATYQGLDIQINASNDNKFIDDVLSLEANKSRISVMHNFYPLDQTGLGWQYFMRCNKKYAALKLPNAVFITSQSAFFGQQPNTKNQVKLPTIEKHRNSSIEQQAIDILEYTKIQEIFIGNYPASDQELVSLKKYAKHFNRPQSNDSVVKLKAHIIKGLQANETKILAYKNHFRRGDLTEGFIRSTNTRILYRDVKPRGNVKKAQIGDIVIINNNNPHYVGELWIIIRKNFLFTSNIFNYVGKIDKTDFNKMNKINSWTRFKIIN